MPQKRKNANSGRIKWTEEVMADLLSCRKRAIAEHQSGQNYQRKDYMEIMRLLWEEKGCTSLGLTACVHFFKRFELGGVTVPPYHNSICYRRIYNFPIKVIQHLSREKSHCLQQV